RHRVGIERAPVQAEGAAVPVVVDPHHQEVARAIDGDAPTSYALAVRRVRVDLEVRTDRGAAAVESLAEDAEGAAVPCVVGPDDDVVARRGHRDRAVLLEARRVGVQLELTAE